MAFGGKPTAGAVLDRIRLESRDESEKGRQEVPNASGARRRGSRLCRQIRDESGGCSRGFVLPQLLAVVRGLQPQPVGGGRPSPGLQ